MKYQRVLAVSLLLLWTVSVIHAADHIFVRPRPQAIEVVCPGGYNFTDGDKNSGILEYKDENSKEYSCVSKDNTLKIYVKLRTCDNCIELDILSSVGIILGNIVATIVMGVAVYLVTSQSDAGPVISHKKSSDRHPLVINEDHRASNDHYQPLQRGARKDTYDVITKR